MLETTLANEEERTDFQEQPETYPDYVILNTIKATLLGETDLLAATQS